MKINIKSVNWLIDQLNLYQSANSDPQSIKNNFIIRKHEFETIVNSIVNKKENDPLQHELILGRRGSGKSTLLKRIEIEIGENKKLNTKYIAINLAEEQAGIYRLFDLWEQVLEELKNVLNLKLDLKDFSAFENEKLYTKYLYEQIHLICSQQKKRVILLLDNFDRIIESFNEDAHLLRETLINYNDLQIIAGSTRMNEHFWQYDQPFYEFFRRHRLDALTKEEMCELLEHWSNALHLPELTAFIQNNPGKLENIRLLTDGLPRTIQFFIQIVLQKTETEVYGFIKKIMDNTTPLFQERLNSLTPPVRKTILEMAFIWEACSTKQLVEKVKMESKLVSANLKMLVDKGIVEKITTDKKMHLYRLAERFFNMWLVVTQGNPEQKRKAKFLTIFFENWYNKQELKDLVKKHIDDLHTKTTSWQNSIIYSKALSQSKYISTGERDRIIELTEQLYDKENKDSLIQLPKKAKDILSVCKNLIEQKKYKEALKQINEIENEEDGAKFLTLGYLYDEMIDFKEAEKYYRLAIEKNNKEAIFNLALLYRKQDKLKEAEKYYLLAIENGDKEAIFNLGFLYEEQDKLIQAEKYYLLAIEKGDNEVMNNLASVYKQQNRLEEAEKQYLVAIENGSIIAINNLGLFYEQQDKVEEAEKYYLLAIKNDNTEAIFNLALLYQEQDKVEEAEKYYLLASEKGDKEAMNNLAVFYDNKGKAEEAIKYYLSAIERGAIKSLYNLGCLYDSQKKEKEAEKYYLLAIENGHIQAMNNLATLYYELNKNKKQAVELIKKLYEQEKSVLISENQIIVEMWNGVFNDVEKRIWEIVKEKNGEELTPFFTNLLIQQQKNLVFQIFTSNEWGKILQEKYLPLYYAVLILNHKTEDNLLLKIPPEIESTVNEIVETIKEREKFYGYN